MYDHRENNYHSKHFDFLFILESSEQENALTKSWEFESGPMIRYFAGEWGLVKTWFNKASLDIFSHHV